jgi:hypothetical protein
MATSNGVGGVTGHANYGSTSPIPSSNHQKIAAPWAASRSLDNGNQNQWPPNVNAVIFTPTNTKPPSSSSSSSSSSSTSVTQPLLGDHGRGRDHELTERHASNGNGHFINTDHTNGNSNSNGNDDDTPDPANLHRVPSSCEVRGEYYNRNDNDRASRSFLHSARYFGITRPTVSAVHQWLHQLICLSVCRFYDRRELWRLYNTVTTPLARKISEAGEHKDVGIPPSSL